MIGMSWRIELIAFGLRRGSPSLSSLDQAGSTLVEPALGSQWDVGGKGPSTTLHFNGAVSLGGGLAWR